MREVGIIRCAADFASLPDMEYPISLGNGVAGLAVAAKTPNDVIAALQRVFRYGLAPVTVMESEEF